MTVRARVIAAVATVLTILGMLIEHALHAGPIDQATTALAESTTQIAAARQLIARLPTLEQQVRTLRERYELPSAAALQSQFLGDLAANVRAHHTTATSIDWSKDSTPGTFEALPGQPQHAPTVDPHLLADIPATLSLTGAWPDLLETLAAIPQGRTLALLWGPSVAGDGSRITVTVHADLYLPLVRPVAP